MKRKKWKGEENQGSEGREREGKRERERERKRETIIEILKSASIQLNKKRTTKGCVLNVFETNYQSIQIFSIYNEIRDIVDITEIKIG